MIFSNFSYFNVRGLMLSKIALFSVNGRNFFLEEKAV